MENAKKYSYIDSLRGYAVLMVLATHVYIFICHSDKNVLLADVWFQCRMGVMLFFMISALTLFLSLERKMETEKSPIYNFFIRRFFRIAPLFYLVFIGNLFFAPYSLVNIISTATFTNGFIPDVMMIQIVDGGWSLAVEMVFYVLLPLIFKYVKNRRAALMLFVVTFVLSVVVKYVVNTHLTGIYPAITLTEYTYYWLPAQLPVFALGIISYFVLFKTDFAVDTQPIFERYLGYFLMFAGLYFFVLMSFSVRLFITENIAFSFALMLFVLGMAINPLSIFNNKFMQFLGKISYSFYLWHFVVLSIITHYLSPAITIKGSVLFAGAFVCVLVVTAGISYVSYRIIEQPFQQLGARLISKRENGK